MEIIQYNAALALISAIRVSSELQTLVSKIMSISQKFIKNQYPSYFTICYHMLLLYVIKQSSPAINFFSFLNIMSLKTSSFHLR